MGRQSVALARSTSFRIDVPVERAHHVAIEPFQWLGLSVDKCRVMFVLSRLFGCGYPTRQKSALFTSKSSLERANNVSKV